MSAVEDLVALLNGLEREGLTMMDLACGGRAPEPWTIYPHEYGIFDARTRSQFYYHSHAGADHEAGHFHTVRLFADRTAHLVAVSMTPGGWPQALFTVNLWAIGDSYETPETLKRYACRFQIDKGRGQPRVVRFVNLMFRVFLPEIGRLQDDKERALVAHLPAMAASGKGGSAS